MNARLAVVEAPLPAALAAGAAAAEVPPPEEAPAAEATGAGSAAAPSMEETLRQLQKVTSLEDAAVLQRQLAEALAAQQAAGGGGGGGLGSPAQRRGSSGPAHSLRHFASLALGEVQASLTSTDNVLLSAEVLLEDLSLGRSLSAAPPAGGGGGAAALCWDEALGLHPLKPSSDAAAAAAGGAEEGGLALSVKWRNNTSAGGAGGDAGAARGQRCSVHVGRVCAAYPPGLAGTLSRFVQQYTHGPSEGARDLASGGDGTPRKQQQQQEEEAGGPGPAEQHGAATGGDAGGGGGGPGWVEALRSGALLLELHAGVVQLAVLSSAGPAASALALAISDLEVSLCWGKEPRSTA